MRSYPFISELFTNILQQSKAIAGRFYLCPHSGNELNAANLEEVIGSKIHEQKFPLAMLMPPTISGEYLYNQAGFEEIRLTMFFLKTSFYDAQGKPIDPHPHTHTSMHTIPQDWQDMKRAAMDFTTVLDRLQGLKSLNLMQIFRIHRDKKKIITPVTLVGAEGCSGVKLDFYASMINPCVVEDYTNESFALINLPLFDDSHPQHNM